LDVTSLGAWGGKAADLPVTLWWIQDWWSVCRFRHRHVSFLMRNRHCGGNGGRSDLERQEFICEATFFWISSPMLYVHV
jgi:hypothetical protein